MAIRLVVARQDHIGCVRREVHDLVLPGVPDLLVVRAVEVVVRVAHITDVPNEGYVSHLFLQLRLGVLGVGASHVAEHVECEGLCGVGGADKAVLCTPPPVLIATDIEVLRAKGEVLYVANTVQRRMNK